MASCLPRLAMRPTLLALPPPVGRDLKQKRGGFFVSKILCPVCASRNTAVGIAPDSTNVSLICNSCNYRDVIFYGDSRKEAYDYWLAIRPKHSGCVKFVGDRGRKEVSAVRMPQRGFRFSARREHMEFLQNLQLRMDKF